MGALSLRFVAEARKSDDQALTRSGSRAAGQVIEDGEDCRRGYFFFLFFLFDFFFDFLAAFLLFLFDFLAAFLPFLSAFLAFLFDFLFFAMVGSFD